MKCDNFCVLVQGFWDGWCAHFGLKGAHLAGQDSLASLGDDAHGLSLGLKTLYKKFQVIGDHF